MMCIDMSGKREAELSQSGMMSKIYARLDGGHGCTLVDVALEQSVCVYLCQHVWPCVLIDAHVLLHHVGNI